MDSKLFVGNLSFETTQREIQSLFAEVGQVSDVFLPVDRETGRPRGFAFVEYLDATAATAAIERFDGYELGGRSLRVNRAEERPQRAPRFSDGAPPRQPWGPRGSKPKGSRRNIRSRKRGL